MATRRGSKSSRARRSKKGRGARSRGSRRGGRTAVRAAWRDDLSEQLRGHRSDALAILFAVAGVIAALGIDSHVAGPAGHALDRGLAALFGGGRYLVPFALLGGGLALLVPMRSRAHDDEDEYEEEDEEARTRRGWRLTVGLALSGIA